MNLESYAGSVAARMPGVALIFLLSLHSGSKIHCNIKCESVITESISNVFPYTQLVLMRCLEYKVSLVYVVALLVSRFL